MPWDLPARLDCSCHPLCPLLRQQPHSLSPSLPSQQELSHRTPWDSAPAGGIAAHTFLGQLFQAQEWGTTAKPALSSPLLSALHWASNKCLPLSSNRIESHMEEGQGLRTQIPHHQTLQASPQPTEASSHKAPPRAGAISLLPALFQQLQDQHVSTTPKRQPAAGTLLHPTKMPGTNVVSN